MRLHPLLFAAAGISAIAAPAPAEPPVRALIITGHNNHNWRFTSRIHQETLEATGRFSVDITEDPAELLADAPRIAGYRLFVLDYNDHHQPRRWGGAAEKNFAAAVAAGAGVVAIHSANNAFNGWADYEKMLGLMWREGAGHGKFHAFDIEFADPDHPITKGLPTISAHPDELYHALVNSQGASFHVLAQAHSDPATGGTGKIEPLAFTLQFAKGRVFATPLGHVWENDQASKQSVTDPRFRALLARGAEWAATGAVTLPATWTDARPINALSADERAQGFRLLFDGSSTKGWRGYRAADFPTQGWAVVNGALGRPPGSGGGDIVTAEQFADFELRLDYKVAKGGNSGIIYRCTEDQQYPWQTGPEYQILDDAGHADQAKSKTRAGTLYDLFACAHDVSRPAGEWNQARVVVKGARVEHWLNGFKVIDIDMDSDAYRQAHAQSKWTAMPEFGKRARGHIALQDHGDEVWFRNIRVRTLD